MISQENMCSILLHIDLISFSVFCITGTVSKECTNFTASNIHNKKQEKHCFKVKKIMFIVPVSKRSCQGSEGCLLITGPPRSVLHM